jgi:hypothetical protein
MDLKDASELSAHPQRASRKRRVRVPLWVEPRGMRMLPMCVCCWSLTAMAMAMAGIGNTACRRVRVRVHVRGPRRSIAGAGCLAQLMAAPSLP